MNKTQLCELTKMSSSTMAKMTKDKPVDIRIIERICKELKCNVGDVMVIKFEE